MRKIMRFISALILIVFLFAGYLVWANNRTIDAPSQTSIREGLEKSIQWHLDHREKILQSDNAILWWMLKESADLTGDARLQSLFADYKRLQLDVNPYNVWHYYFNQNSLAPVPVDALIHNLPDYNLLFVYGLTCNPELGGLNIVQSQLQEDFCQKEHPISPACVTHQVMGLRFMQRRNCGEQSNIQSLILALQEKIVTQLTWDPRPVDVYIQRVLMLVDSGARDQVKPVWLRKVLDAQMEDGGWCDFFPLIRLGKNKHFGLTGHGIDRRAYTSEFHATAQGLLLMALLNAQENH